ncbi:MAG: nucleotidyltransferase family protein [Candidatus Heimdallarchaeota archaeon]|nr:MAG: nucleotidyltransferase family protein [Candidatus Heimdallarchaeota archaeon]
MITCIVLAAGESRRFPGNKLLFEIKPNLTIIEYLLMSILASKVDRIFIVLGHEVELVNEKVQSLDADIHTIINPHYKQGGMSSSIRRGMEEALDSHAVMITPADIPFIPSEVFNQLIDHYRSMSPLIIIPTYQARKGHPILISSQVFKHVLNISEEKRGLKEIIELFKENITYLPTNFQGILHDIDDVSDITIVKSKMDIDQ